LKAYKKVCSKRKVGKKAVTLIDYNKPDHPGLVLKTFKPACECCGLEAIDPTGEYDIRERVTGIEFDNKGNRYIIFQLNDSEKARQNYYAQIKVKNIKPVRILRK
jgi:hypothetical protein